MSFENKIALVTGGTSGIGKEIVTQLLKKQAIVIVNYNKNEKIADEVRQELIEFKDNLMFIKADISDENEVITMFKTIKERYGKLDYLVNNAGTNIDGYIESFKIDDWKKVIDVNLVGKLICTKYAIELLKNSENSSIVNIASKLGTKPAYESSAYCCAESAIIMLTKTSALELSKYKIRVNTVSPGFTPTPLSTASWSVEEIQEKIQKSLLKRLGKAQDMANSVLFLLSDEASYINGENINVNGGTLLI